MEYGPGAQERYDMAEPPGYDAEPYEDEEDTMKSGKELRADLDKAISAGECERLLNTTPGLIDVECVDGGTTRYDLVDGGLVSLDPVACVGRVPYGAGWPLDLTDQLEAGEFHRWGWVIVDKRPAYLYLAAVRDVPAQRYYELLYIERYDGDLLFLEPKEAK